ncbi:hypothetical protein [Paenibacillus agilis]|uniref:Uncharacterized protein n=1 Tax=Paenibacillus agilis TaxID=3020863 RepID=A0A559IZH5_9BACL|nr:hypothetical protein [Paenibacillus agilis]TVX93028.1 hypothetical protein FPZ44_08135 [Paenibacillus agilis]
MMNRSDGFKNITLEQVTDYQHRRESIKTIGEFKELGKEIRDKHGLTDREALDILNNRIGG